MTTRVTIIALPNSKGTRGRLIKADGEVDVFELQPGEARSIDITVGDRVEATETDQDEAATD